MIIKCIGSGSSGNCYLISDNQTSLLLECGFKFKKIQEVLDFKTTSIKGCLITHKHGDHIKGLKGVLKHGIDCYIGEKERVDLIETDKDYNNFRLKGIEPLKTFKVGTFTVLPFDVQHDTSQPLGYLIQSDNGEKLLFATDTYYISYFFSGITHLLIECNNSLEILRRNSEHSETARYVNSRVEKSHFSLENLIEFLKACDLSKLQETYLIHLSDSNSDEALFKHEIQKVTGRPVYVF